MKIAFLKNILAVLLALAFTAPASSHAQQKTPPATPYLQLSDIVQSGYKGWIKEVTIKEYDRAEKKNGQWQPLSDAHLKTVYHYDKHGFLTHYEISTANNEQEFYVGKVIYSRKADTITTKAYNEEGNLVWTMLLTGKDPLGYNSWTYNKFNQLTEQNVYKLDRKYLAIDNKTTFYDSTGNVSGQRNINRTYLYEGAVQKVTAVFTSPGYKETDTVITRNTTLKKDEKGNKVMTLRKEAGQPHYILFHYSFLFYDE